MKASEKIFDSLSGIRDDIVDHANTHKFRGKRHRKVRWISSIAAILAIAIAATAILWPGNTSAVRAYAIAQAEYPEMAPYPDGDSLFLDTEYDAWWESIKAQRQPTGYSDGLDTFWTNSIRAFLDTDDGKNKVYSPVNVYLALCMLAEVTDGETRQQILDALDCDSMEDARVQANQVWNANYRNDGASTSILASSLWLDEEISFRQETVDLLAENYYASSYQGDLGTPEMDAALQSWLNEQTGGLLEDQISNISLDPLTVLVLATTLNYRVKWSSEFSPSRTVEGVFHAAGGDTTVEYMTKSPDQNYYWSDQFAAVSLGLEDISGHMWFILPDEGIAPEALLQDEQLMAFINSDGNSAQSKYLTVNLSVPKFDINSQLDLTQGMQTMGITAVFDYTASDFSPITTDLNDIALSQPTHGVRVAIDEAGITAAAYTVLPSAGAGAPPDDEVDFVLDRPFLFVITGADGEPMFVGIVNQI